MGSGSPLLPGQKGREVLWYGPRGRWVERTSLALHPFIAAPADLRVRLPGLKDAQDTERVLYLPTHADRPQSSHSFLQEAPESPAAVPITLVPWKIKGVSPRAGQVISWLVSIPDEEELRSQGVLLADDSRFWKAASYLVLKILLKEQFLPGILR